MAQERITVDSNRMRGLPSIRDLKYHFGKAALSETIC
jgi:hypothetical protein